MFGGIGGYAWSSLTPTAFQSAEDRARTEASVNYSGCNEVRALGKAPLLAGQPGYRVEMDGDGDGIACEPHVYGNAMQPDVSSLSRRMIRTSLRARL